MSIWGVIGLGLIPALWFLGKSFVRQWRKQRAVSEMERKLLYRALMDMPVGSAVRVGILVPPGPHYGDKSEVIDRD